MHPVASHAPVVSRLRATVQLLPELTVPLTPGFKAMLYAHGAAQVTTAHLALITLFPFTHARPRCAPSLRCALLAAPGVSATPDRKCTAPAQQCVTTAGALLPCTGLG